MRVEVLGQGRIEHLYSIECLFYAHGPIGALRWTPLSRPWTGQFKIEATMVKGDHAATGVGAPAAL
jgi:hypothetical protein